VVHLFERPLAVLHSQQVNLSIALDMLESADQINPEDVPENIRNHLRRMFHDITNNWERTVKDYRRGLLSKDEWLFYVAQAKVNGRASGLSWAHIYEFLLMGTADVLDEARRRSLIYGFTENK
jgi:hypothetical protein